MGFMSDDEKAKIVIGLASLSTVLGGDVREVESDQGTLERYLTMPDLDQALLVVKACPISMTIYWPDHRAKEVFLAFDGQPAPRPAYPGRADVLAVTVDANLITPAPKGGAS
jgi:hypothetical protein